ncbi:leucine-rich repeat extensin-like protein 1 [Rhodamnia argentea]|uniref:Leucine-rich repeat extensin-like protein 1 n=1 Tax=Rhodamnia argentea TaxID=178133 RepID=A0A8B8P2Y3_9MYRT|nr:leucine-rich repeat extensin-like protein 1 [Rhodamnia argentea]
MEKIGRALSTLALAFAILSIIETTSSQESCPYPPCANDPPPAAAAAVTTPAQTGSYPAPAQPGATTYPPPAGYFPYSPPPPSGGFYAAPPPPDPILPYFPYYYRKPPRTRTEPSSADAGLWRSTVVIIGVVASLGHLWFCLMVS